MTSMSTKNYLEKSDVNAHIRCTLMYTYLVLGMFVAESSSS